MQNSNSHITASLMTERVQRLRTMLLGFGFLWISFWALLGSLIGYKINEELMAGQTEWLNSTQRALLRSAHAHMNTMAILCMATGLALPLLCRALGMRLSMRLCAALPISVVVFGTGMGLEAAFPPTQGSFSQGAVVTALGGSAFILICLVFGIAAIKSALSR